ncbi:MAG: arginine--tRNA ligase [Alphaproteobacteria bacterium]
MISLLSELNATAAGAFAAEGLPKEFGTVQPSDRPDLAQFQCNGALAAAKAAKTNPRAIAEKIAARLRATPLFLSVAIAGPGFINLTLKDEVLQARLQALAAKPDAHLPETGKDKKVIIDFGGPNIAKPMHVGHLRSAVIGDCLQRLFRANGWNVIGDIHMGDWGLPMGQLISEIGLRGIAPVYFDAAIKGPYPETSPVTMEELEELYPAASAVCKADPKRLEAARQATAELQDGRPGYRALWQHFVNVSIEGLRREYDSLGIHFDWWKGEADVDAIIKPMIADLRKRGIAVLDEGALIVRVEEPADQKEMPPLILLKSDGAVLYGTTDLATIVDRVRAANPELILYVVDQRQHGHFEQVFRAARKAHLNGHAALEHIGFGTMNGPDGKPFKTREGGVMKLFDLIAMVSDEAAKRLAEAGLTAEYPEDEKKAVAKAVGIGALKFADLSNHRLSNYIFDLERFTRFEGRTGPYLQYAAVRIKSILRKAADEKFEGGPPVIRSKEERDLALQMLALPETFAAAEAKRAPNILCEYVFTLAQYFSGFYTKHHILSESDAGLRAARLGLCAATLSILERVLDVLGITVPERM